MGSLTVTLPPFKIEEVVMPFSEVYDWGLIDLGIPDIHKQTMGEGIKIAIIDSGKTTHHENAHNAMAATNLSDSPVVEDRNGHSSFVSGIIGAAKDEEGIIGVAPKAQLYFSKSMNDGGSGSPSALTNGILWAIQQGVDIISISAGLFSDFKPLRDAVQQAHAKNITIVAACGNTGKRYYDIAFPARYPEVIGVAAYSPDHHTAPFSSRGANISFAMPGVDIYSCWLNDGYSKSSGTSFACPILSGTCALILAKHRLVGGNTPCTTPQQVYEHLVKYAVKLDDKTDTGFGTIDLKALMQEGI